MKLSNPSVGNYILGVSDVGPSMMMEKKNKMHHRFALLVGVAGLMMAGATIAISKNIDNSFDIPADGYNAYRSNLSISNDADVKVEALNVFKAIKPSDRDIDKHVLSAEISNKWKVDQGFATRVVNSVYNESKAYNLDPKLVLSIIAVESSFRKEAVSSVGAEGLMQVWRKFHTEKFQGISDNTSIEEDIGIGVKVLNEYLHRENRNTMAALQRYNGTKNDSTKKYSNKVMEQLNKFKSVVHNIDRHEISEKLTRFIQVKGVDINSPG